MSNTETAAIMQRVRHEFRSRHVQLLAREQISPGFIRLTVGGPELQGFVSAGFDDHTKLFFPEPGAAFAPPQVTEEGIDWGEGVRPATRDYTPLYDAERHELAYDFYIHDGGIASRWALEAKVGDKLVIGGPRGSLVVPEDYAWQLYVCDESGMPALRRQIAQAGQIVDGAGDKGGQLAYAGSKNAVTVAVRQRATTWGQAGIRLNTVAPGAVETPLLQAGLHDARYAQAIKNFVAPLGRRADPSEIAAAVAFLLSPQASFIHGTQLFIDGGMDAMVRPTQF